MMKRKAVIACVAGALAVSLAGLGWLFPHWHSRWEGFQPSYDYPKIDGASYYLTLEPLGGTVDPVSITGPWRPHLVIIAPPEATLDRLIIRQMVAHTSGLSTELLDSCTIELPFRPCTNINPLTHTFQQIDGEWIEYKYSPPGYVDAVFYTPQLLDVSCTNQQELIIQMTWATARGAVTNEYSREFTFKGRTLEGSGFSFRPHLTEVKERLVQHMQEVRKWTEAGRGE